MVPTRAISLAYAAFGLLSGAASIYSAWLVGPQPAWARPLTATAGLLLLMLAGTGLRALWPVLRTNPRGLTLVEAVRTTGLVDVESRNEGDRHLPPEALYRLPDLQELVITGISASSSFQNHLDLIKRLLADKKDVYFLVCSEDTPGLETISRLERRNVVEEIKQVRHVIDAESLQADERFHIKAFAALPTFTAVMVNGDFVPRQPIPRDSGGFLRIQPRRMASSHHDGIVLQFQSTGQTHDGFSLFAGDLREQWSAARPWRGSGVANNGMHLTKPAQATELRR